MTDTMETLAIYLHLVRASDARRRPHVRDRLLVMAAMVATRLGLPRIAEECRRRILENNPNHLLRNWPTLADAMRAEEFQSLARHLERKYPREKAEQMLVKLGIDLANEGGTYYADEEYAAALLGVNRPQSR